MTNARETLQAAINDLGITVEATFIPWSRSRNFDEKTKIDRRTLNWTITLKHNGRTALSTDYSAGIASCPSYKQNMRWTMNNVKLITHETERGTAARYLASMDHISAGKPIVPDTCAVVYSLVSDASVIDYGTFESWASDLGYDIDSRSAEQTYRACLGIALKLRAAIGDEGLTTLRTACEGF